MTLRPYQREAIQAVLAARRSGLRRLLVALPTGAGKTVIFSELARLARRKVLVLAHREELVQQARDKLERALGGDRVVAVERGAERAGEDAHVIVCSIRSLYEERLARVIKGRDIGLVIYDECHHAPAADNQRVLRQLGVFDDDYTGTLLGFTATTERGDGQGLDTIFERIVYSRTLPDLIEDGYLCPLRGFRIQTEADLRKVTARGQDFEEEALAEAVDIEERNALVARSIQELARDRRTIAFCVTVRHAKNLARSLNTLGVPTGVVYGALASDVRAKVLDDFRRGALQVLTNVAVLRRPRRLLCRDGTPHALGRALRAVRGARHTTLSRQEGLPDLRLRRSVDAEPVHPALAVRRTAGPRSARRRRTPCEAHLGRHRLRPARLRARSRNAHARRAPRSRAEL